MTLIDPMIQRHFIDVRGILIATRITRSAFQLFSIEYCNLFYHRHMAL